MPRGLALKTTSLIDAAIDILSEIQPTSVRGVCYQLFVLGLIPNMSKNETQKVSRALTTAREHGVIPWQWIVDETRQLERLPTWSDPSEYADAVTRSYRKDWWADQPQRVLVISEKATVGGILRPVLREYGVPFQVFHGFGSATALNNLAGFSIDDERPLTLLYVGDHDPSGRHMSDVDIPTRLERYGGEARLIRLAVTPEQIDAFALSTFSVTDKKRDSRFRWFAERHGDRCCELDALDPNLLRQLVKEAIVDRIDHDRWEHAKITERAEQASIEEVVSTWKALLAS